MRNQLNQLLILTFLSLLTYGCEQDSSKKVENLNVCQAIADSVRLAFIPDQRVDRFRPTLAISANDCVVIRGQTTNHNAHKALLTAYDIAEMCIQDSMQLLPLQSLGKDTFGIINVSVANLRTQGKHFGELTTQVLLGMPIKLLAQQGNWFLIQSPEQYIAWLEAGAFVQTDAEGMRNYYNSPLAVVKMPFVQATYQKDQRKIIRDLSTGGIVQLTSEVGNQSIITLPDGQKAKISSLALETMEDIQNRAAQLQINKLAHQFYGAPYLWGGTSAKGMDCSGFTKMTYLTNGYIIPRDASQQVHAGQEVPIDESFSQLQSGDLLFFGNLREDGSQRISHTGIYLGEGKFVHSGADNGYIKEQSLLANSPDFASHRKESLLRAKRLSIGSTGVTALTDLIAQFQN